MGAGTAAVAALGISAVGYRKRTLNDLDKFSLTPTGLLESLCDSPLFLPVGRRSLHAAAEQA